MVFLEKSSKVSQEIKGSLYSPIRLIDVRGSTMGILGTSSTESVLHAWPRRCESTSWTVVLAASKRDAAAQSARGELYRRYFYPVYAYIASSAGTHKAEDLTQAFFVEQVFEDKGFQAFNAAKCRRFRAFLFTAVDHFLNNHWKYERRRKRDVRKTIALDFEAAEIRFLREPSANPERRFDRAWAVCVLQAVLEDTRVHYCASSRNAPDVAQRRFSVLKAFLQSSDLESHAEEPSYAEAGRELSMCANTVAQNVRRLRELFVQTLRSHVRELVSSDDEVEAELRFLREALAMPAQGYERHLQ